MKRLTLVIEEPLGDECYKIIKRHTLDEGSSEEMTVAFAKVLDSQTARRLARYPLAEIMQESATEGKEG
jgi:hypothetical protein